MTTDIGDRIASRILQLRLSKGLTQEQLAERADIDASVISRIERGSRTNLRLNTLSKIVDALDIDYEIMFSFPDSKQAQKRIKSKLDLITDEETLDTIEKLIDLLAKSSQK